MSSLNVPQNVRCEKPTFPSRWKRSSQKIKFLICISIPFITATVPTVLKQPPSSISTNMQTSLRWPKPLPWPAFPRLLHHMIQLPIPKQQKNAVIPFWSVCTDKVISQTKNTKTPSTRNSYSIQENSRSRLVNTPTLRIT